MGDRNLTSSPEFILMGFSDLPQLKIPLLIGFLLIYLTTISGNLLVISMIYSDSHLHTPMYFFLSNLSFVDICYTSIIFPSMLASFFLKNMHITLRQCLLQLYFFSIMLATEFFLLTIMSFDRYAAICNPLKYVMIMNRSRCLCLTSGAWILGITEPIFHMAHLSTFSFCKSLEINHFFCDYTALLKLSCTSTRTIEIVTFNLFVVVVISSCLLILTSYIKIISAILKIQSSSGRYKAFSTCASHLTVVIIYYGFLIFVYLRPASKYSVGQSKIFSLVYIEVIPMCNPIIYTLKNKDFKDAVQRRKGRKS